VAASLLKQPATENLVTGHDLSQFESLGDDCEFGVVQRAAGHEPLGLLRFAFIPLHGLLDLLGGGLDRLGDPADMALRRDPRGEVEVELPSFGMRYHTDIFGRAGEEPQILAEQQRRLALLRRKFLEDLQSGDKIFVRKGEGSGDVAAMRTLLAALRRHGPATLLWVSLADGSQPVGAVEVVEPFLLRGHIDRFAAFFDQPDLNIAAWLEIGRGARLLRLIEAPPGTVRPPVRPVSADNLLRQTLRFEGPWWRRDEVASSQPATDMPPPLPGATVMTHILRQDTAWEQAAIFGRYVPEGLAGGGTYVASLQVFLPQDFTGSLVGMVFDGFASAHTVNADLARRGQWQRAWVQARIPEGMAAANPSLVVLGPAGTTLHSACWKLEQGVVPTEYVAA
jgi:hypothetical protein